MKYIYNRPDLRVCVSAKGTKLELHLEICKRWLFFRFWCEDRSSLIVVSFRNKPEANPKVRPCEPDNNPRLLHYDYGNAEEVWTFGTFNLEERIKRMFEGYTRSEERLRIAKQYVKHVAE